MSLEDELLGQAIREATCKLCHKHLSDAKGYISHVAKHLESIALAAIPQVSEDDSGDERFIASSLNEVGIDGRKRPTQDVHFPVSRPPLAPAEHRPRRKTRGLMEMLNDDPPPQSGHPPLKPILYKIQPLQQRQITRRKTGAVALGPDLGPIDVQPDIFEPDPYRTSEALFQATTEPRTIQSPSTQEEGTLLGEGSTRTESSEIPKGPTLSSAEGLLEIQQLDLEELLAQQAQT